MRAYAALAAGREVVLYDQSGCGRSTPTADLSRYTLARYVAQLSGLRAHLRLERMIVLGHSCGGMLAPRAARPWLRRADRPLICAPPVPSRCAATMACRGGRDGFAQPGLRPSQRTDRVRLLRSAGVARWPCRTAVAPGATLVTCGEFDEVPAWVARKIVALVPRAQLIVFAGISRISRIEDPRVSSARPRPSSRRSRRQRNA